MQVTKVGNVSVDASRVVDRHDEKWWHPLVREGCFPDPSPMTDLMHKLYSVPHTDEEREELRQLSEQFTAPFRNLPLPPDFPEEWKDYSDYSAYDVPGCEEEPEAIEHLEVHVPRSRKEGQKFPVIFHIPGGGLINASSVMYRAYGKEYAYKNHAVVVMPEYRCLPFTKYPEPINDLQAAYEWIVRNPEGLPIDSDNITISGISTGGQLALCLGFRLKRYGYQPRGIIAENPITDDRLTEQSSRIFTYDSDWSGCFVKECSAAYLGEYDSGSELLGPEAMANYATVEDCKGYPPVTIITGEFDPDRDYCLQFVSKLYQAGVYVDLHVFGGAAHSVAVLMAPGTQEFVKPINDAVAAAHLNFTRYDLRRPWTAE